MTPHSAQQMKQRFKAEKETIDMLNRFNERAKANYNPKPVKKLSWYQKFINWVKSLKIAFR